MAKQTERHYLPIVVDAQLFERVMKLVEKRQKTDSFVKRSEVLRELLEKGLESVT